MREKLIRYSFCEAVTAGPQSRWHIRPLTEVGPKLGGGVDTPSLCGHIKPPSGWDLEVAITSHHLGHACPECVEKYRKEGEYQVVDGGRYYQGRYCGSLEVLKKLNLYVTGGSPEEKEVE